MTTKEKVSERALSIRARTWALTFALVVALVFYILMKTYFKDNVNIIDLIVIATLGIVIHCIYFPDGEIFGMQNETYKTNKKAYNEKATAINKSRKVGELRDFCKYDFEERKKQYIENECGAVGIDEQEYEMLKTMSPKEINKLDNIECEGKLVFFTRKSRKRLYKLLFKELPVEKNDANTILSACETSYVKSIKDTSIQFKTMAYVKKISIAVITGLFLGYIGYTFQDGITLEKVARLFIYLASMFTTAVMSFSKGETCQKVYKNRFYVDLANFIDRFNEYLFITKGEQLKEDEQ